MTWGRSEEGWAWLYPPSVVLGASYPARVDTNDPDPDYKPRPVGFTADLDGIAKPATEPLADVIARVEHTVDNWQPDVDTQPANARCPECDDIAPFHHRCCPHHEETPWP